MSRQGHPAFSALSTLRIAQRADAPAVQEVKHPADEEKAKIEAETKEAPAARDAALWRDAVRDVVPRARAERVALSPKPPPPLPRQRERAEARVLAKSLQGTDDLDIALEGEEADVYLAPSVPRKTLTDLRRGRWVIQAELDLHGLTREGARLALNAFLDDCKRRGLRCLRVIHGKGLSSPGRQPILRPLVRQWLIRHASLLAFCPAKPADGGSGALLLLLRSAG